ncbi:unnamed protein product [Caretta caretta]
MLALRRLTTNQTLQNTIDFNLAGRGGIEDKAEERSKGPRHRAQSAPEATPGTPLPQRRRRVPPAAPRTFVR